MREHRDRLSAPPLYEKDRWIYTPAVREEEGRNTVEEDYYYTRSFHVAHRKMVKQLSEKRRQAYLLYLQGMSYASIADRSVSERTVGDIWECVQDGASGGGMGYTGIRRVNGTGSPVFDNMYAFAFDMQMEREKGFFR